MTETKQITLSNGGFALVDAADYDRLMKYTWRQSERGYALRTQTEKGRASGVSMHRMLLDPPKAMMADHINGNRLDNRRCNLRIVSALQNAQNRGKNKNSVSQYKGVAWKAENGKWQARIRVNSKQHHIGLYEAEVEAAAAYNAAAILHHGNYARLNMLPENYAVNERQETCPLCHRPPEPVMSGDRLKNAYAHAKAIYQLTPEDLERRGGYEIVNDCIGHAREIMRELETAGVKYV